MSNNIIPFDDFHTRRHVVESELNNVNNEINNITGKITLLKYTTQNKLIEYQQALHKKNEVDKLLSFHLSKSLNHPKMNIYGYTKELDRLTNIYNKFRDKYISMIPKEFGSDINISFPELNKWKVDHLQEIRRETNNKINENYIDFHNREIKVFDTYQMQRHKLEWSIQQLEKDKNISIIQKNKKRKLTKNSIQKLEEEMYRHLDELTKTYPDLIKETQLIDRLSSNEHKNIPIKLDEESDEKPEVRLVKRRLILLNLKKQKCRDKLNKVNNDIVTLDETKWYKTTPDIDQSNYTIVSKKNEITDLRKDIRELDDYMRKLLESREVLIEEINLLESMESLTNNDVINELIRSKPFFNIDNQYQIGLCPNDVSDECVVSSNMIDISHLVDNIDIDKLDLNNITNAIDNKLINNTNKTNSNPDSINRYAIEMGVNNFESNSPNSTQIHLNKLTNKLKKLEQTNTESIMNIQDSMNKPNTNDNINNNIDIMEIDNEQIKPDLINNINNDNDNQFDVSDMELLRQFDMEMENNDFDSGFMELENNVIPQLEITKEPYKNNNKSQNNVINSQLENLIQINQD
jgi:hypothetical protein